jgi:hypothetical protein
VLGPFHELGIHTLIRNGATVASDAFVRYGSATEGGPSKVGGRGAEDAEAL